MSRLRTLPLAIVLGSTLAACGSNDSAPGSPNGSPGGADTANGGASSGGTDGGGTSNGGAANGGAANGGAANGGVANGGVANGGAANGGVAETGGDASMGGDEPTGPDCGETTRGEWLPVSTTNAPTARTEEWVIPTDDGMLVWGGLARDSTGTVGARYDDGAIYHLCENVWRPISTADAPASLTTTGAPIGIWTGSGLIVWGGIEVTAIFDGYPEGEPPFQASVYDADADRWEAMDRSGEPSAREDEARVWTGTQLLVWGGVAQSGDQTWANHQDGALYDPETNGWTPMSTVNAPEGRAPMDQYAWTGREFIVWGGLRFDTGLGFDPVYTRLTDGAVYDLASDSWTTIASEGAPTHSPAEIFWTGSKLLALGVLDGRTTPGEIDFDGALLDVSTNTWSPISPPSLSLADSFVWGDGSRRTFWTGDSLVILGERVNPSTSQVSAVALVYDPTTDDWRGADLPATPAYGTWQGALLIDGKIAVWGRGSSVADSAGADHETTDLALFDPETMTFSALPLLVNRGYPAVVGSAHHLLTWGGGDTYTDLDPPDPGPCQLPGGICDPITPTITELLGNGLALGL